MGGRSGAMCVPKAASTRGFKSDRARSSLKSSSALRATRHHAVARAASLASSRTFAAGVIYLCAANYAVLQLDIIIVRAGCCVHTHSTVTHELTHDSAQHIQYNYTDTHYTF